MKKLFILIPLFATIISCTNTQEKKGFPKEDAQISSFEEESPVETDTLINLKDENTKKGKETFVDSLCYVLYEQFIGTRNQSPSEYIGEEGYYLLDIDGHINQLRQTNLFTEEFLQNENLKFKECADTLRRGKIRDEDLEVGIDMEAPNECGFFNYSYYFQSQEAPMNYELLNTKTDSNKVYTEIHYYDEYEGERHTWDDNIFLKIEIVKDSLTVWKFNQVEKVLK